MTCTPSCPSPFYLKLRLMSICWPCCTHQVDISREDDGQLAATGMHTKYLPVGAPWWEAAWAAAAPLDLAVVSGGVGLLGGAAARSRL